MIPVSVINIIPNGKFLCVISGGTDNLSAWSKRAFYDFEIFIAAI